MSIRNKSPWKTEKARAVALGKSWVEKEFAARQKDDPEKFPEEPTRKGKRKGEEIGFSKRKWTAAFLGVLHPLLQVKELARLSGVSPTVLMVWRSQANFQMAEKEACSELGKQIRNSIQNKMENRQGNSVLKPNIQAFEIFDSGQKSYPYSSTRFINLLPFLNPLVSKPTVWLLSEKIIGDDSFKWLLLNLEFHKSFTFHQDKTVGKWARSSVNLDFIKFLINSLVSLLLLDPGKRGEVGEEQIEKAASAYRGLLFSAIDLIAEVEPSELEGTHDE